MLSPSETPPALPTRELLAAYRADFTRQGVGLPLPLVPAPSSGLLAALPAPPEGKTGWPWTTETPPLAHAPAYSLPRLSIVVPSFRQGSYIEEAMRSILLQNYPSLELIVLDGGSTDETSAVLEKYRPWLSFVRIAPDRGQGHAINLGFALASGEIVAWLNSDDAYLPGAFIRVAQTFAAEPTLEFVYGDGIYLSEAENKVYYNSAQLALDRYLHFGGLVLTHAAFWRHRITEPIWEALKCNVDGELWFRLLRGSRRRHLPLPLGAMRGQADAKSVNPRWLQAWKEDDALVWSTHGRNPAPRSLRAIEHRRVQRFYAAWIAGRWRAERTRILAQTNWAVSPP
jgi:hypothetical protein